MTSGTKTIGTLYSSYYYSKTWSGANGKYETISGKTRTKWNNYDMTLIGPNYSKAGTGGGYIAGGAQNLPTNSRNSARKQLLAAQADLASKIKADAPNLTVEVAQGFQTMNMVYGALRDFTRCALALRRGNFSAAARSLGVDPRASRLHIRDVAGRWLELQYGWLPTLGAIYELADAWSTLVAEERKLTYVGKANDVLVQESSTSPSFNSIMANSKCRCRIEAELVEIPSNRQLLGLEDPLSVAWELLPWSFVVDWFIPIGTYLEAGNQIPRLQGRFLTTYSYRYTYTGVQTKASPTATYKASTTGAGAWVERRTSTSLKVPPPQFRPLNEALSPKRLWNALALATQAFTSTELIPRQYKRRRKAVSTNETFSWQIPPGYSR